MDESQTAYRIHVTGIVQGVGFRPFVYRLAQRLGIRGWVRNDSDGVWIHAEGEESAIRSLAGCIRSEAPPAAVVHTVAMSPVDREGAAVFRVVASTASAATSTAVSPDLCICVECLQELRTPGDARFAYPYINCTNCGPRYSILVRLPYDRVNTTMDGWALCAACRAQYENPADRRFHAQPVACPACGPNYELNSTDGERLAAGDAAIRQAARLIADGVIVGVKGIGGYHAACDARNEAAIERLRARKFRKEKPFALMVATLEQARELVELSAVASERLLDGARPIVLAPRRAALRGVAPGVSELGVMLPYAPLHHLLFEAGAPSPLVLTSANRSAEPIAYEDDEARVRLAGICDALLVGARPIARRVDDSVVSVRRGRPFVIRRARGLAPRAVARLAVRRPILAVGADLKNTVALAIDGTVYVSPHIGDLDDAQTRTAFRRTIDDWLAMYAIDPRVLIVAHDLHPEYASTHHALTIPCARRIAVQHHAAHIAATLAEHEALDVRVVGIALDGTGLGDDGAIWGGEVLVGSLRDGFERRAHLRYAPLPGGDAAARHPVQCAAGYLAGSGRAAELLAPPFEFPPRFSQAVELVRRDVRCFPSSSTGRLFDAAAAILGFTREISFEAQAAIWLEELARPFRQAAAFDVPTMQPAALLEALIEQRRRGSAVGELAARFHSTVVRWFSDAARDIMRRERIETAVLAGGVFQNARILEGVATEIEREGRVLVSEALPVNDGAICVGQAAMAAQVVGDEVV